MNYPTASVLSRFDSRSFSEIFLGEDRAHWTSKDANAYLGWWLKEADCSVARLTHRVGTRIEAVPEIFPVLDSWLARIVKDSCFARPVTPASIRLPIKGHIVELEGNPFEITEAGWTIIFDTGIVFAKALMNSCPALCWKPVLPKGKSRKVVDVDCGLPALFGFASKQMHLQPQVVVHVIVLKYIRSAESPDALERVFNLQRDQCLEG